MENKVSVFGVMLTFPQFVAFNRLYCDSGAWIDVPYPMDMYRTNTHGLEEMGLKWEVIQQFLDAGYFEYADIFGNLRATNKLKQKRNDYMKVYRQVYPDIKRV